MKIIRDSAEVTTIRSPFVDIRQLLTEMRNRDVRFEVISSKVDRQQYVWEIEFPTPEQHTLFGLMFSERFDR